MLGKFWTFYHSECRRPSIIVQDVFCVVPSDPIIVPKRGFVSSDGAKRVVVRHLVSTKSKVNIRYLFSPPASSSRVQVYILDKDYAWRPAILDETKGDKAFVTVPEYPDEQSMMSDGGRAAKKGSQVTLDLKQYPHKVLPLQNVDANGNLTMFADMVKLPYLHEVCMHPRAQGPLARLFIRIVHDAHSCSFVIHNRLVSCTT